MVVCCFYRLDLTRTQVWLRQIAQMYCSAQYRVEVCAREAHHMAIDRLNKKVCELNRTRTFPPRRIEQQDLISFGPNFGHALARTREAIGDIDARDPF